MTVSHSNMVPHFNPKNHKFKGLISFFLTIHYTRQLQQKLINKLHGPAVASRMHWVTSPSNQSINPSNFQGEKLQRRFNKCKRRKQSHTFCSIYEAAVLCVRRVWGIKSLNSELPPWTLRWIIHLFVEDVFDWGAEPEQTTHSSRRPGEARWDQCSLGFRFAF